MTLTLLDNRYQILRALGSGGFGETFLAEDTHMPSGRRCVIKQLKPVTNNPQVYDLVQERFRREAAILEELGDASNQIPRLYAYFESAGQFYLVQEWVEGETLAQKVQEQAVLSESFVKQILVDILPVLEYVHSKRIIHRDIKPDNIILRQPDGKPVLIDFGAVKETMGTEMTSTGNAAPSIVIGTPGFMPSEQSTGRPVYSSDLYSLGLTAIYLLAGKVPQQLETDYASGEIIWRQHALNVSPTFAAILDKAIRSHPRERFSTARAMLEALQGGTFPSAPTLPLNQPPTVASQPPAAASYPPPQTVASPPPANTVYQQPTGVSPQPVPTGTSTTSTKKLEDWQKAAILGSAIGAVVVAGIVVIRPQLSPNARSPEPSTTGQVSATTSPAQSSVQQPSSEPTDSSQSTVYSPQPSSISQQQAVNLIEAWLQAKKVMFAPPYEHQIAAELTTGELYEKTAGLDGSITSLKNDRSYYRYGVQRIDGVEQFAANGNRATIQVRVTEERTLYGANGNIDPEQTDFKTRTVVYNLEQVDGRLKIADSKIIK